MTARGAHAQVDSVLCQELQLAAAQGELELLLVAGHHHPPPRPLALHHGDHGLVLPVDEDEVLIIGVICCLSRACLRDGEELITRFPGNFGQHLSVHVIYRQNHLCATSALLDSSLETNYKRIFTRT